MPRHPSWRTLAFVVLYFALAIVGLAIEFWTESR